MNYDSTALAVSQVKPPAQLFLNLPLEIAQLPLRPSAKLVYGALKMHCRHRDVCRVRWATLQAETGLSRASIARALKELRTERLVANLRTGRSSYYAIYPPTKEGEPTTGVSDADEPAYTDPHTSPPDIPQNDVSGIKGHTYDTSGDNCSSVDNSTKSHSNHFHKRNFAEASTIPSSIPTERLSTKQEPPRLWCKNSIKRRLFENKQTESANIDAKTASMAPLIAFLLTPIQDGGLGWKPHRGHLERVLGYISDVGIDQATKTAYRCFEEGDKGGAALWDWTLSQRGFGREARKADRGLRHLETPCPNPP